MKRITSVILCAFVACASALYSIAATEVAAETVNGVKWIYKVSNGKASLGGNSTPPLAVLPSIGGAVTIPPSLGGYPVTSIGANAFRDCSGLTSVTIPACVTSIGSYAFYGCIRLTSVTIPNSVTNIGSYAFHGCSGLTSVTIPEGVTSIGESTFKGCWGLASVTIPNNVTNIENDAFASCGLESVTVPDSVTRIGPGAFSMCRSLTDVTIGKGVTRFADIFGYCSGLTYVTFSGNAPIVSSSEFLHISAACNVRVPFGSTGWNVDIPGIWNGLPIDYTVPAVKFNANGGVLAETARVTDDGVIDELPIPRRKGYSFAGWFTAPQEGALVQRGMSLNASMWVYAHWLPNTYVVSLNPNGGRFNSSNVTVEVVYDTDYGNLPSPNHSKTGYSFSGWFIGDSKITAQTIVKTAANHELVAHWAPRQYSVTYDANGGRVPSNSSMSVTFDASYGNLATPIRTGYTFVGWKLGDEIISRDTVVATPQGCE